MDGCIILSCIAEELADFGTKRLFLGELLWFSFNQVLHLKTIMQNIHNGFLMHIYQRSLSHFTSRIIGLIVNTLISFIYVASKEKFDAFTIQFGFLYENKLQHLRVLFAHHYPNK